MTLLHRNGGVLYNFKNISFVDRRLRLTQELALQVELEAKVIVHAKF